MPQPDHPILSIEAARALEARLFGENESAEWEAMTRAGEAIADAIANDCTEATRWSDKPRLLVLAGKGHNGGDALIAAKALMARFPGSTVDVVAAKGTAAFRPLAARAWREMNQTGRDRVRQVSEPRGAYDAAIDGLYGMNFRSPLDEADAKLLKATNEADVRFRAAVDLPSGIGEADGFRADFTYATGVVKRPLVDARFLQWTGRVRYLDLGFFDAGAEPTEFNVLTPSILDPLRRLRPAGSDKRHNGHVLVLAGSMRFPGAALMTVTAAVRAGAGLVTACVPEPLVPAFAAQLPEAMWVPWPTTPDGSLALEGLHLIRELQQRASALLLGPGLGREAETTALLIDIVRDTMLPIVLDADALRSEVMRVGRAPRVLTPHPGEWDRIHDGHSPESYCRRHRAVLVCKGPQTHIYDGNRVWVSLAGGPVLGRGGSGDMLAGMIAARAALPGADLRVAACEATLWHGLAADALARKRGAHAVRTTELLDYLVEAVRDR